jgi:hypothetical protein
MESKHFLIRRIRPPKSSLLLLSTIPHTNDGKVYSRHREKMKKGFIFITRFFSSYVVSFQSYHRFHSCGREIVFEMTS